MGSYARQVAAERFIEQFGTAYFRPAHSVWEAQSIQLVYDELNGVVNKVLYLCNTETDEKREIVLDIVFCPDDDLPDDFRIIESIVEETGLGKDDVKRRLAKI